MLKSSPSYRRSYRSSYRKPRPTIPLALFLLAIPLVLILLELITRLLVGITGNSEKLATYEGEPSIVTAYRLKFLGQSQQPYDGLSDHGYLAAQKSLAGGYGLVGNQQSNFWRINAQGFRDNDPVPLAKPKNEIRIFLLGGSTAFGQWNTNNQATLASKLEARLNARVDQQRRSPEKYRPLAWPYFKSELDKALTLPPRIRDGQYRVINAAVPGYASGNTRAQLALQILPYNPDVILVLDGYTDLTLPSREAQTDIPELESFLSNASGHFWTALTRQWQDVVTNTYLIKAIHYWLLRPQPSVSQLTLALNPEAKSLEQHLTADSAELERRVTRYRQHLREMIRLTTAGQIPVLIALQPEITGRTNKPSPQEQELLNTLSPDYKQQVQTGYAKLAQANQQLEKAFPKNVKTLNFYKVYDNFSNPAFADAIHLTEAGNAVLSERFYRAITVIPKLQVILPKPPGIN